ncbi:MAG TPA: orotidine-5'-phosphate decarboxylase [Candidatus Saccharimonadales bacterium]|nr:orotidine-5'-phosphate decarboxylase [Candidatus Saccharimonadales bacterium]
MSAVSVKQQIQNIRQPERRIVAALDYDTTAAARHGLYQYGARMGSGKVNSLADLVGVPQAIKTIRRYNQLPFVDYKLHDIPETMRKRARNLTLKGAAILTVHALAGKAGMEAADQGINEAQAELPELLRPLVLAVTVLTSHDEMVTEELFGHDRRWMVRDLAHMAVDSGIDGLVCSPREADKIRHDPKTEKMVLIVPAIRPSYVFIPDDQSNPTTPKMAIEAGADMVIVGRPLTEAASYGLTGLEAFEAIAHEIGEAA